MEMPGCWYDVFKFLESIKKIVRRFHDLSRYSGKWESSLLTTKVLFQIKVAVNIKTSKYKQGWGCAVGICAFIPFRRNYWLVAQNYNRRQAFLSERFVRK